VGFVNRNIEQFLPDFYAFYEIRIHQNFESIDLMFVLIFLSEFLLSWILAIVQKAYYRWFFYPILHWYDLAGCIPVGSFRFLRVLRIFSILIRLNNLKVIQLSKTYVVIKLKKYYNIIVEEVSDRVVVNILEGVQEEISEGGPVVDDIIEKVVKPKKELIVEWVSRRVGHAVEQDVLKKRAEISEYVRQLISESLSKNEELRTLEQVPVMGRRITETIQRSISDTINDIIEQALTDLASSRNRLLLKEMADVLINAIDYHDKEQEMDSIYSDIAIEIIDVVKKQVLVQKWKLKESSENGMNETEKDGVEFLLTDD
jgi:hypothetical protein